MRKSAILFVALLVIVHADPARAAQGVPPAQSQAPQMLGLTGEHWLAIGLGALTGWGVVHHVFRVPAALAIIGGGLAGSWYWQSRTPPASGADSRIREIATAEDRAVGR